MKPLRQQIVEAITGNGLAYETIAGRIADVVLRTIGNSTIKALEEENATLKEEINVLHDTMALSHCNGERLITWLDDPNRKPAHRAFTEGMERQVAYRVEDMLRENS